MGVLVDDSVPVPAIFTSYVVVLPDVDQAHSGLSVDFVLERL